MTPKRSKGCANKNRYDTRESAESARRDYGHRYGEHGGVRVYRCKWCGGWHLGHDRKGQR